MKILLIDDELSMLEFLAKTFREDGYAVDTSSDGEDGLYKAQNWDYDAIVLDVLMPRLNGWEVLKRLRQTKKTPVLMLTSRDGTPERVRGLDNGADDYVGKPFEAPELLARLRALIRRTSNHAQPRIELSDVVIDLTTRTVTRAGEPVEFRPREYAILEYLALHRGKTISRTELYEHLCDENDDTLSNAIDVHIGRPDRDPAQPRLLHSCLRWGLMGFTFVASLASDLSSEADLRGPYRIACYFI
ncbi:MAG: response regulator transcription factor [Verrucomicrobia bacterium]|nr:response regulator transcription factor [Verrucomicrobiota bacterium]